MQFNLNTFITVVLLTACFNVSANVEFSNGEKNENPSLIWGDAAYGTNSTANITTKSVNPTLLAKTTDFSDLKNQISASITEGNTTSTATPIAVPLPTTVWGLMAGFMGILAISKRRND
jgi:hypothetical protein